MTERPRHSSVRLYVGALTRDPLTLVAVLFLVTLILAAIFAPYVAPFDPEDQSLMARNLPPMTEAEGGGTIPHLMGTDQLGRDLLSRLVFGARISLTIGLAGAVFSGIVGSVLGLVAGYYRGTVDDIIIRLVDIQMGFPSLMTALLVLYVLGPGAGR